MVFILPVVLLVCINVSKYPVKDGCDLFLSKDDDFHLNRALCLFSTWWTLFVATYCREWLFVVYTSRSFVLLPTRRWIPIDPFPSTDCLIDWWIDGWMDDHRIGCCFPSDGCCSSLGIIHSYVLYARERTTCTICIASHRIIDVVHLDWLVLVPLHVEMGWVFRWVRCPDRRLRRCCCCCTLTVVTEEGSTSTTSRRRDRRLVLAGRLPGGLAERKHFDIYLMQLLIEHIDNVVLQSSDKITLDNSFRRIQEEAIVNLLQSYL